MNVAEINVNVIIISFFLFSNIIICLKNEKTNYVISSIMIIGFIIKIFMIYILFYIII